MWTGSKVPPKTPMRMGRSALGLGRASASASASRESSGAVATSWKRCWTSSGKPAWVAAEISKNGRPAPLVRPRRIERDAVGIRNGVALRRDENAGPPRDVGRELHELPLDRGDVRLGVAGRRGVDEMAEQAAALDVLQEPDAEPGAAVRALDQSRDVRHDERAGVVRRDDARGAARAS